jgi:hypothetical protein
VTAAEGMEQHVELKNKLTIQDVVADVLTQDAADFSVEYQQEPISELEYLMNVARQKQRTVTQSDAFHQAKKHGSSYGGQALDPRDLWNCVVCMESLSGAAIDGSAASTVHYDLWNTCICAA